MLMCRIRHCQLTLVMKQSGQYFTFLYGVIDRRNNQMTYVRAGHPQIIRVQDGRGELLDGPSNIPIGWAPEVTYEQDTVALEHGDTLYFYTDGYYETRNHAGEEFGFERLIDTLSQNSDSLDASLDYLKACVAEFREGDEPEDDMTIAAVRMIA